MSIFAVTYVYGPAEEQAKYRPDHRAYLTSQLEAGKLLASGPYVSEERPGALLIFSAESESEVAEILKNDPMNIGGAVLSSEIREWNPVLGSLGK
ncbi:YciI family protein [Rothia aerolata]|uniref:YCII-related domain-containing protein n=1 Tax=Rothia aerolata TaxID=1812262 RepID=A0A917IUS5_9MICC|nr:YciI family protein [Rothia aerolata]GGH63199.1 hypothetical protein GCM10007359_14220 [Rothia aerolata]